MRLLHNLEGVSPQTYPKHPLVILTRVCARAGLNWKPTIQERWDPLQGATVFRGRARIRGTWISTICHAPSRRALRTKLAEEVRYQTHPYSAPMCKGKKTQNKKQCLFLAFHWSQVPMLAMKRILSQLPYVKGKDNQKRCLSLTFNSFSPFTAFAPFNSARWSQVLQRIRYNDKWLQQLHTNEDGDTVITQHGTKWSRLAAAAAHGQTNPAPDTPDNTDTAGETAAASSEPTASAEPPGIAEADAHTGTAGDAAAFGTEPAVSAEHAGPAASKDATGDAAAGSLPATVPAGAGEASTSGGAAAGDGSEAMAQGIEVREVVKPLDPPGVLHSQ